MGFQHQSLASRARGIRLPGILRRRRAPLPDDPRMREGLFAVMLACYRGYGSITLSRLHDDGYEQTQFNIEAGHTIRRILRQARKAVWQPADRPGEYLIAHRSLATLPDGVRLALSIDAHAPEAAQWRIIRAREADDICEAELFLSQLLKLREAGGERRRIDQLSLLTRDECSLLAERINDTDRDFAACDLLDALAGHAARQPDAPALIDGQGIRGWRAMHEAVLRLSQHLQARYPAGRVVGAHLARSADSVIALFAFWHAGLTWLPLPPGMPASVLAHMVETAGAQAVLSAPDTPLPEALNACEIVDMGSIAAEPAPARAPKRRLPGNTPAAILFTSGTTGMPNGVSHSHRALMNRFLWWRDAYPFTTGEVPAQRTALSFIPSLTEMVSGVLGGCPLLVVPDADSRDPQRLLETIAQHGCTRIAMLPSLLQRVLAADPQAAAKLASLRYLVTAGEPLPADLVRRLADALPRLDVVNDYGCTETNGVLALTCSAEGDAGAYLPAGRPIANCRAYILLPSGHHAPVGVTGELYVTGLGLGDGYLGKPELNRSRYKRISVPDFGGRHSCITAFKTNDRACWRSDGRIEVMGRLDNVLKIRGIRVDLEATEAVLNALPEIAEAACCGIPAGHGDTRLVAWIVPSRPQDPPQPSAIRTLLRERLPEAAIPARILITEALPRTANGKLARARLAQLHETQAAPAEPVPTPDSAVATALPLAPPARTDTVLACLGAILDTDPRGIDPDTDFKLLGLDSASVVDFVTRLREELGHPVAVSMVFDAVTPRALAQRLAGPAPDDARPALRPGADGDIAVVGLACRMPRAADIAAFWRLLRDGGNAVGEIPPHRWDWRDYSPDNPEATAHSISRFGAFLDDEDKFDPAFFNISVREAQAMAPEQRIFLETAWQAFADAGLSEADMRGAAIGVFAGARSSDYSEIRNAAGAETDALGLMGCDNAILAARIAYHLDLKGPVLTIDTACSASLVAVHAACAAIRAGECDRALAGGVSLVNTVTQYLANSRAGMLSPDGRCAAFDASANGFVQGEGCGAVVLKPLRQARADGDRIYAVIKGSAVNQDGRTNGITAPNGDSQRSLMRRAHEAAGIGAGAIGMVEAHGTGTRLGDPIEFDALCDVFREAGAAHGGCALGSVKTNIGHLIAAAGIAGFLKACLSLHHRQWPQSLHFAKPNPHIAVSDSPFFIPTRTQPWPASPAGRRHAAVSAFGFSGTNCHLVLEEAPDEEAVRKAMQEPPSGPFLFGFSARNAQSLRGYAQRLADWCASADREETDPALAAHRLARTAHALARRMNDFDHAALILTGDMQILREALTAIADDTAAEHPAILFCGQRRRDMPGEDFRDLAGSLRNAVTQGHRRLDDGCARTLARLYAHGVEIDLPRLTDSGAPLRPGDLPPYAFNHRRYWAEPPAASAQAKPDADPDGLAANAARFAGHRIGGRIWLPATAQLILAQERVAREHAPQRNPLQLRDWELSRAVDLTGGGDDAGMVRLEASGEQLIWRQGPTAFARARLVPPPAQADAALPSRDAGVDIAKLRALMLALPQQWNAQTFYAHCSAHGLDYSGPFRGVRHIGFDAGRCIAVVAPASGPDGGEAATDTFLTRTALLDAACHVLACLTPGDARHVPVAAQRVDLPAALPPRLICMAQIRPGERDAEPGSLRADLRAFDPEGKPVFGISGLRLAATADASNHRIIAHDSSDSCEIGSWIQHSLAYRSDPLTAAPIVAGSPIDPEGEAGSGELIPIGTRLPDGDGSHDHHHWFWRVPLQSRADMIEALTMHAREITARQGVHRLIITAAGRPGDVRALGAAARAIHAEHSRFHCRVTTREPGPLAGADFGFSGVHVCEREDAIKEDGIADGDILPESWQRLTPPPPTPGDRSKAPVCLVTGGFGGIGRRLCAWLVAQYDARIIIASHRAARAEEETWLAQLRAQGAEIVVQTGDFTRQSDCRALLRRARLRFHAIDRVYHCAGVSADAGIANKTRGQIEAVLRAKLDTLEALDAALGGDALEQMVLFSSISAVIGTAGQCDYAAANAWLDAFAHRRNGDPARRGHTIAINWALWADGRMAPPPSMLARLRAEHGMAPMPSGPAFDRMEALAAAGIGQAVIAWGELAKLDRWLGGAGSAPQAQINPQISAREIAA